MNITARLLLVLSLLSASLVSAEQISFLGLNFNAEDYAEIDEQYVKAKLDGAVKLIERSEFKRLLAFESLRNSPDAYAPQDLFQFGKRALEKEDVPLAGVAFAVADQKSSVMHNQISDFVLGNGSKESLIKIMLKELSSGSESFAHYLFLLGDPHLNWIRANLQPKVLESQEAVLAEVEEQSLTELRTGAVQSISQHFKFLENLYGGSGKLLKDSKSRFNRINIASDKIDEGKFAEAYSLLEPFASGQVSAEFARAVVSFIHHKAKVAASTSKASEAIHILALINFRYRTPESHELVSKAISEYPTTADPIWSNTRTDTFILALAKKDQQVYLAFLDYILSQVERFTGPPTDYEKLRAALRQLSELRPDPNSENDELRIELTIALHDLGLKEEAIDLLHSLKRSPSFSEKLRLFFAGVYIKPSLLALIVFSPILLWFIVRLLVRSYYKPNRQFARLKSEAARLNEPTASPRFIRREGLDPRIVEYLDLLKSLELGDKASEKEIKSAYRNKIKSLHPDLRQTTTDMTKDFVKLKSVYERILALRDELGL